MYVHVCVFLYVDMRVRVCRCVYIYMCMYICVYVCISIQTWYWCIVFNIVFSFHSCCGMCLTSFL